MEESIKAIEQREQVENSACGCGSGGCGCHSHGHDHAHGHGHMELPVRFQILREGDRVVEFGSGTGNDVLAAAQMVGPSGKVVGIDLSEKNIRTARDYSDQLRATNVEFRQGDIHDAPVAKEFADIVLANCVFNLQDDKQKVADEMYRICHHNGLACVSDFVVIHDIPLGLREDGAQLAGCIGGAENIDTFMNYFRKTGFQNVKKDVKSDVGIFNVTLIAEKPSTCSPETCCCNPDKHKN